MCLAMLAAAKQARGSAGALLAAATLVKPFPVVIAPALWRRWDWRMPLAFLATVVACYLPYLGAGRQVLGFLSGYGDEERYLDGSGFFPVALLRALGLPSPSATIYGALAIVIMGGMALYIVSRDPKAADEPTASLWLAAAFLLLTSPHYAWYFAWVLPLLCRVMYVPLLYLTLVSVIFNYVPDVWGPGDPFTAGVFLYGGFVLLAVAHFRPLRMRRTA
jgi:alpha-1,6-mannosyltransferase